MSKILTLWDIDGNIVNVYRFHTPSYQKAIMEVYGVEISQRDIEKNYGRHAKEVVAIPLLDKGFSEKSIHGKIGDVFSIYSKELEMRIGKDSGGGGVVLPGVLNLLRELRSRDVPMGVVTGNIRIAGEAILNGSGLSHYFNRMINSYADDAADRNGIVSNAIMRARKNRIVKYGDKVYVFGDTAADVESAKANGCLSVAVVKNSNDPGSSPGGDSYSSRKGLLEKSRPDFIVDDYTDSGKILSILGLEK